MINPSDIDYSASMQNLVGFRVSVVGLTTGIY